MNIRRTVDYLALGLLFVLAAGYYLQPVADIDFWWHLAAGRFISATGTIPSVDPFGIYEASNYWGQTVLKGQWLGQVMLYGAYQLAGLDGVNVLRMGLLTSCIALIALQMRLQKTAFIPLVLATLLAVMSLRGHLGERPQLFSFVLFVIEFIIIDFAERKHKPGWLFAIPLLMMLWANIHPGVILGCALFSARTVIAFIDDYFRKTVAWSKWRIEAAVVLLAWLATLVTPNGITSYEYLVRLEQNPLKGKISDYTSPFMFADKLAALPSLPWYFLTAAIAMAVIAILVKRKQFKQAGVALLLLGISASSYRYIPFFVLYIAPLIGQQISQMRALDRASLRGSMLLLSAISVALGYALVHRTIFHSGIDAQMYPVAAVDYMARTNARGKVFNTMNWGGYLSWRMGAQVTPFIDGRLMEPDRAMPYMHVLWMTPAGQSYFNRSGFDIVLIRRSNAFDQTHQQYPLINYLACHPAWQLVGSDPQSVLFYRRSPL